MKQYHDQYFEGERPLFAETNATIEETTFGKGESPLKESQNIKLRDSIFAWKYPLWYSRNIQVDHSILKTMARSGIWYTHGITIQNSSIQAPKSFRRSSGIELIDDHFSNAQETLWRCDDIKLTNIQVNGDYFGMNSSNIYVSHLNLIGNYVFDGGKNIEIHHSTFVSKDAFWNCENVTIYDSTISGEYLAWNTKNLTLINCAIESNQGLCYIDHLKMRNCRLLHTDLTFEYCSNVDAEISSSIMSIKNPLNGKIHARSVGKIILDPTKINPGKTTIITDDETRGEVPA